MYLAMSHRLDEAVRAADAGLAINPNNAFLYSARAAAEKYLARFDEAKSDFQTSGSVEPT
jgi:Flp pilus assembly protein TadD